MAIKKKKSYRLGFLGFMAILCYCLSAVIGLVWISVGVVFVQGGFDEKNIHPTALYFEYPDLTYANNGTHKDECLRITGITQEIKDDMIENAEESLKPILEKNVVVDRKFVVKCNSEEVNILSVNLSSSDPTIATVPRTAEIGKEISITPTKINGINKGGFVEITAWTSQGVYVSETLKVLVDVPIQDVSLSLSDDFDSEIIEYSDELEPGLQDLVGERVYYMYENDSTTINFAVSPQKALNPTLNAGSNFNAHIRANKGYEFDFDESYDKSSNAVELNSQTGNIKVNAQGVYKIWFKIFKTYDDQIYINDYEFEYEGIDEQIPESDLYGRYEYAYLNICVMPIVLVDIQTNNSNDNPIRINLFDSIEVNYNNLAIKLYSNRNETEYFSSAMDMLVLESSNSEIVTVEKVGAGRWNLTALNSGNVYFTLYHQFYPEIICELDDVEIKLVEISDIIFEGTSKYSSASEYNDMVKLEMNKNETDDEVEIIFADEWSFANSINIISIDPNLPTSYSTYKVFAIGSYIDGNFDAFNLNNEQGNPIINTSTFYAGIGYQIDADYIQAVSRGEIDIVACVIRTDINGHPIMIDVEEEDEFGNPQIVSTYDVVARSNALTVRVVELLRTLSASIDVYSDEDVVIEKVDIESTSTIIVENSSSVSISLIPNSLGAIIDATNYGLLRLVCDESDVYPNLDGTDLSLTFEINDLGVGEYQTRTVSIQIFTYSYETIITLNFKVFDVPMESIKLNINMEKNETDGKYHIVGEPTYTNDKNDNTIIKTLSFAWGQWQQDDTIFNTMSLLEPTFTPVTIEKIIETLKEKEPQILPENLIIPKPLEVTNYGHTYISSDPNTLQVKNNQLLVKKIGVDEVTLTLMSTAKPDIFNTIELKFTIPSYDFNWTIVETTTINATNLTKDNYDDGNDIMGIKLDNLPIKLQVKKGSSDIGNILPGDSNKRVSIKFVEGDNFTKQNVSIKAIYDENDNYLGQYISSTQQFTGTIFIDAVIDCGNGLQITQTYEFTVV